MSVIEEVKKELEAKRKAIVRKWLELFSYGINIQEWEETLRELKGKLKEIGVEVRCDAVEDRCILEYKGYHYSLWDVFFAEE